VNPADAEVILLENIFPKSIALIIKKDNTVT